MPSSTQCPECGIILNLPDQAVGKRLKCPRCGTKFAAVAGGNGSPGSTILLQSSKPPSSQGEMDARRASDEGMPTAPGDLRDTFDLPLLEESSAAGPRPAAGSKPTGDALSLFEDNPRSSKRRLGAAEARSKMRRCPTCGGVVPVGMSLCAGCGLDLETGTRVALDDDLVPPPPPPPSMPIAVGIIGGISFLASLIFTIATISLTIRGHEGLHYFVPLCLFAVFASVQFLRLKSVKLLLIALTLGLGIAVVALIALPIYHANTLHPGVPVPTDNPDLAEMAIPSVADQLDTQSLAVGIALIVVYSGVAIYLLSPQVRRTFRAR